MKKQILALILLPILLIAGDAEGSKKGNGGYAPEDAANLLIQSRDRLVKELLALQGKIVGSTVERSTLVTVLSTLQRLKQIPTGPDSEVIRDDQPLMFDYDPATGAIIALKPYYQLFGATSVETAEVDQIKVMRKLLHESLHIANFKQPEAKALTEIIITAIKNPNAPFLAKTEEQDELEKAGWRYYVSNRVLPSLLSNGSSSGFSFKHKFLLKKKQDAQGKVYYILKYSPGNPDDVPVIVADTGLVELKLTQTDRDTYEYLGPVPFSYSARWRSGREKRYDCDNIITVIRLNVLDPKESLMDLYYTVRTYDELPGSIIDLKFNGKTPVFPKQSKVCDAFQERSDGPWTMESYIIQTPSAEVPMG